MLNIELIRFAAQDVITTSLPAAPEAPAHNEVCAQYKESDHKTLAAFNNGVPNQIYLNGEWVVCDCDCHK